jgi:pimeloyl-ACP methyl ester carboxylesterase
MKLNEGYGKYFANIGQHHIYFQCKFYPASDEAIIFIHGLACSVNSFSNVFDKDYFPNKSLLLIDLPGFGSSAKPIEFSYTMEEQAKLIDDLLHILPFQNFHIAAHSMGGAIALLFSSAIFQRVKSFTNIEGNLISEDCGALSRSIASLSYEEYKNDLFQKQLVEFKDHRQLEFEKTTPFAVYRSAVSLVDWSDSGELLVIFKNLTCRKCYFYGEQNKEMPVLAKLNFVKKYMVSNSGHGLMTDNPEEFYKKLKRFIVQT